MLCLFWLWYTGRATFAATAAASIATTAIASSHGAATLFATAIVASVATTTVAASCDTATLADTFATALRAKIAAGRL